MNTTQDIALLIAGLLFLVILLLIVLLIRTRNRGLPQPLLIEEEEDTIAALPPVIVRRASWEPQHWLNGPIRSGMPGMPDRRISRYPLVDLRRRINGLVPTPILNIPPAPPGPILFAAPNGATIGRGPLHYR